MRRLTNYQEQKTVGLLTSGIQPYRADYAMLLSEQPDSLKRSFYEIECANNNWSTRELDRQINSLLFERLALAGRFKRIIAKQFERATLKGADKIIVINKGLKDYAVEMGVDNNKISDIPAGVDLDKFNPE